MRRSSHLRSLAQEVGYYTVGTLTNGNMCIEFPEWKRRRKEFASEVVCGSPEVHEVHTASAFYTTLENEEAAVGARCGRGRVWRGGEGGWGERGVEQEKGWLGGVGVGVCT